MQEAGGCTVKDTLSVTVKSVPLTNIIQPSSQATYNVAAPGTNVTLKASGATSYLWSPAGTLNQTTGATVVATPSFTTTYKVVGSYSNGCTRTDSITLIVPVTANDALTSIAGIDALVPNPAESRVELSANFVQQATVRITLSDIAGHELATLFDGLVQPGAFAREVDLRTYSTGMYLVSWDLNGVLWHQKLQIR
jgi:hypothetical protein